MKLLKYIILTFLISFYTNNSLAWNYQGHQIVGEIADELIKGTNAEWQVQSILGDKNNLKSVSTWADCVRSVKKNNDGTFYYDDSKHYDGCDASLDQNSMIDYVKRNWDQCSQDSNVKGCHTLYHFTDVAIQRDAYHIGEFGTSNHDVVHAINAAIIVLQGGTSPAPFNIANKKEALQLLVHFVGDETQPLHVTAIYLNDSGDIIDPDKTSNTEGIDNRGGNELLDGNTSLHTLWDSPPKKFTGQGDWKVLLPGSQTIKAPQGEILTWPTTWATDTIFVGKTVFQGLTFGPKKNGKWLVKYGPDFTTKREDIQEAQLQKGGANLANLLMAIWPNN